MSCGVNFKYNYFVKGETWPSCDIVWRPGPEFSISVPLHIEKDKKVIVRDSWMRFDAKRPPVQVWDSWTGEVCLPIQTLIPAPARGKVSICIRLYMQLLPLKCF